MKLIKSTVASGGVAVVVNPSGDSLELSLTFPIIHVKEQDGELTVRIGLESGRQVKKKSASFEIWNTVLQYRSRAVGTFA